MLPVVLPVVELLPFSLLESPEVLAVELLSSYVEEFDLLPYEYPCPEHVSVGSVSFAKYSVIDGHPLPASFPVIVQMLLRSTEEGTLKSFSSRFS